jgi:hypothetical protein
MTFPTIAEVSKSLSLFFVKSGIGIAQIELKICFKTGTL